MNLLLPLWRAKRRIEGIVQRIVVRTNFPPFSWCYASYYRFVLWVAVAALKRIPQVVSIYLTGGLSRKRISYGRSDIDLMVFIREGGEHAVRRRCEMLRFLFPVLPAKEVGVFVTDDLDDLLRRDIHLSYRLLYAPVPARLLYGQPLTRTYAAEDPERSATVSLIGRFEFLWNILLHRLIHMPPPLEDDRDYLYSKLSRQFVEEFPRCGEQLTPKPVAVQTDPAEVYKIATRSLFKLGQYCAAKVSAQEKPAPRIDLHDLCLTMGSRTRSTLDCFVEWLLNQYADNLQSVLICPSYVLPVTERELSLYIVERNSLDLEDVRIILKQAEAAGMRNRIDLNFMSRDIAFSIDLQDLSRSVVLPLTKAATFLYLASPECVLHGVPLDPLPPVCDLRAIAEDKKEEVRECIDGQPLTRLTPLAFQELTWQALQTTSIIEMDQFPLTSSQACRLWQEHPGMEWLTSLHEQYAADLDGRPSHSERFFQRGIDLIHRLMEHGFDARKLAS